MTLDRDSISLIVGEENADFLETAFKQSTDYNFINKYLKNLKKQITTAINLDMLIDNQITLDEFDETLKSDIAIDSKYNGFFIKGLINERDFYAMLSFFNCNVIPRVLTINDGLVFHNSDIRIFVNDLKSDNKNIAILFKSNIADGITYASNVYFSNIDEINKMNNDEAFNLSYDLNDLDYKSEYFDYNSGANLYEVQDALFKTYTLNPADYLITLGVLYRLKNLGWDKSYIDFIASKNRAFNVLNSDINITLNSLYIDDLLNLEFIDESYSITDLGRSALLLLSYATPINSNNYGNFYVTISELISSQKIKKEDLVYVSADNTSFYGIKNEFFVDEKCLFGMPTGLFTLNSDYAITVKNSFDNLVLSRAVGYSTNIKISNADTLELEICNELYNTFNNDTLNVLGGLVSIQPYNSKEVVYVNSLTYSLIKVSHKNIYPYISKDDSSYVFFKNDLDKIVGFIKTKKFSCYKEDIGTQDLSVLFNKINKNYSGKLIKGLDIGENKPVIIGVGFVEKAELSVEDYNKLLTVSFVELKSTLNSLNKDVYFSDLDEKSVIEKILKQRNKEYQKYLDSVKSEMNDKLLALELLKEYFISVGNGDKTIYYLGLIESYKEKITNFIL
jgi:hypothetical protein